MGKPTGQEQLGKYKPDYLEEPGRVQSFAGRHAATPPGETALRQRASGTKRTRRRAETVTEPTAPTSRQERQAGDSFAHGGALGGRG